MRQTGGFAVGAISTKSSSCCLARSSARWMTTTPNCSESGPMTRTSEALMRSLIRVNFWIGIPPVLLFIIYFGLGLFDKFFTSNRPLIAFTIAADGKRFVIDFFIPYDDQIRNLSDCPFTNTLT